MLLSSLHGTKHYIFFKDSQWAEHSVQLPARLAKEHPHLIHIENTTLHRPNWMELNQLYGSQIYNWRKNYAIHLWYRFHNKDYNLEDIKYLETIMDRYSDTFIMDLQMFSQRAPKWWSPKSFTCVLMQKIQPSHSSNMCVY